MDSILVVAKGERGNLLHYLRLLKPRIVALNLLVALFSMLMAWRGLGSLSTLIFTLVAGGLAVAGACAVNAYLDRDVDARMKRTLGRPLPSGRIKPPHKALFMGASLIALSLLMGLAALHPLATTFIALGVVFYLLIYTAWLKRRSAHNIVIGGFAGSCSALAGWAAATGSLSPLALVLALLIFLWTPAHFWPFALVFKDDYARAGIPMLPNLMEESRVGLAILTTNLMVIGASILPFLMGEAGLLYLLLALALGSWVIGLNLKLVRAGRGEGGEEEGEGEGGVARREAAWKLFKLSSLYLALLLSALLVDVVIL